MCNLAVVEFVESVLPAERVTDKHIIEVGARDTSILRQVITKLIPRTYLGVDMLPGNNVDEVCRAEELCSRYGEEAFDVLISMEVLEHVQDWRKVINNFKRVIKPGGYVVITTRSHGFGLHAYPYDFWRWEAEDMEAVFRDFEIIALERDWIAPGIFLFAQKPLDWQPLELKNLAAYSTVHFRRISDIPEPIHPSGFEWLLRRAYYIFLSQGLGVFLNKSLRAACRIVCHLDD